MHFINNILLKLTHLKRSIKTATFCELPFLIVSFNFPFKGLNNCWYILFQYHGKLKREDQSLTVQVAPRWRFCFLFHILQLFQFNYTIITVVIVSISKTSKQNISKNRLASLSQLRYSMSLNDAISRNSLKLSLALSRKSKIEYCIPSRDTVFSFEISRYR